MKTSKNIFNRKAFAFLGAAAFMFAAVFIAGCKTEVSSSDPVPDTFALTFKPGEHGSVDAKVGGKAVATGAKLEKGTTVEFTATPESGYEVNKWTVTGGELVEGTGAEGSTTAKVKVTANTKVNVNFTKKSYAVTFSVNGGNGSLSAKLDGNNFTGGQVEHGKTLEFTATPNSEYEVDKWSITGGELESGTGTKGSTTAKVKITGDVTVSVTFQVLPPPPEGYVRVYFGENGATLDNYLKNTASSTDVNKIEVRGLTAADLKGNSWDDASPLGKILKASTDKKVALKFGGKIEGLTDMSWCFYGCTSLTQAPAIPSGVTNMVGCFEDCTSLTQAPEIPSGVTIMAVCFYGCTSLAQAPVIPAGVTDMYGCFKGCTSLTQAPAIPAGVTDMRFCFYGCTSLIHAPAIPATVTMMWICFGGCTSLTQAPAIPTGVTSMKGCFSGCTSLTQAPAIPSGVTDMHSCFEGCTKLESAVLKCNYNSAELYSGGPLAFEDAFKGCTSLPAGGIKVPAAQLDAYKAGASTMGVPADRFAAE